MPPKITIVGAGLAGTLLACYLGRAGRRVDLYEKRPDPRASGRTPAGRSTSPCPSAAFTPCAKSAWPTTVLRTAIPMPRPDDPRPRRPARLPALRQGPTARRSTPSRAAGSTSPSSRPPRAMPRVRVFFGHRCTGIDLATGHARTLSRCASGGPVAGGTARPSSAPTEPTRPCGRRCNGRSASTTRRTTCTHGYKELTIRRGPGGAFRMEKHALHIWPRRQLHDDRPAQPRRLVHLHALSGRTRARTASPPCRPRPTCVASSREQFPDAVPLHAGPGGGLPQQPDRPAGDDPLPALASSTAGVVLLGDACHAVVPFLGQGMNAAFEDCTVLDRCLADAPETAAAAFAAYEAARKEHTDALADLCVENFIEMRDQVGSRLFLLRKKLEMLLHAAVSALVRAAVHAGRASRALPMPTPCGGRGGRTGRAGLRRRVHCCAADVRPGASWPLLDCVAKRTCDETHLLPTICTSTSC